jgi:hypothetical protein
MVATICSGFGSSGAFFFTVTTIHSVKYTRGAFWLATVITPSSLHHHDPKFVVFYLPLNASFIAF